MLISVLGLSLLVAVHPLRLGVTLLVISRPRPVHNLLTYWAGSLMVGFPILLLPLLVLHGTPVLRALVKDSANPGVHSGAQHLQIGLGVLSLSVAAIMAVRFATRQRAYLPAGGGNASSVLLESHTPTAVSRLLGLGQGTPTENESATRRLLVRAHRGWETGALWVALALGVFMGPSPDVVLTVLAVVVPSGAPLGSQVCAAFAFLVGMLAVVEVILLGYLITPARTESVLRTLHAWASAQHRRLLVATFAAIGGLLVAMGMGAA
ncbi:GAP family protein [Mycobacterium sp. ACS4054]|uniref:GAP family protein n=1 Tax=Mycobacterium sp. ACS4054 TaxID=1834119 RepID=UPI000AC5845E|nr:GAP family protein [Mycobacterium sp. ACS4054]